MESAQKTIDATAKLVEILGPLDSEQRNRAVSAALVLLGEPNGTHVQQKSDRQRELIEDPLPGLSPKASGWAKKHGINVEQLEHVFAIEADGVEVIAARAPGKSKRAQTIESYILCGLASFFKNGDPSFSDEDARDLCRKLGAYDTPNHFNYVKGLGNLVSGSKEAGWKLTNPGLARAAEVVKELSPIKIA